MASNSALLILKIFEEYSDEMHPLSKNDILDYLEKDYDLSIEEKQFYRKIEELDQCGFNVIKTRGRYSTYYLEKTTLRPSDVIYIVSLIAGNESISKKETKYLIEGVLELAPLTLKGEGKLLSQIDSFEIKKSKINNINNFKTILEAIEGKKQIRFKQIMNMEDKFIFSNNFLFHPKSFRMVKGSMEIMGLSEGKKRIFLLEEMINVEIMN